MIALIRLPPMSGTGKDTEILALRHQLAVAQRQSINPDSPHPTGHSPPPSRTGSRPTLRQLHLIVSPNTVLRWHRDLIRRHHAQAGWPKRPGRPRTNRSIRTLVLRLVRENPRWGYREVHGELAAPGISVAPSAVREIRQDNRLDPAPGRHRQTGATFLHSPADALLACDFFETRTVTGARRYVFAVIEPATRRIHIPGATARPTAAWTTQMARNLVMDLHDAGTAMKYLIRDRDSRYPAAFDAVLADSGIILTCRVGHAPSQAIWATVEALAALTGTSAGR
jgi:putative transposase